MSLNRGNRRRGVLILIVLSVLVMFGLMCITFVLITGQAKRTALTNTRTEQYFEPGDRITHEALLTLLRGQSNLTGAVGLHSLLEDMYGNDVVAGSTTSVTPICLGQLMSIEVTGVSNPTTRVGCVLTMRNGPAALQSTRIVGYDATQTPNRFLIVAFDDVSTATVQTYCNGTNTINYVINGDGLHRRRRGLQPGDGQARPASQGRVDCGPDEPIREPDRL